MIQINNEEANDKQNYVIIFVKSSSFFFTVMTINCVVFSISKLNKIIREKKNKTKQTKNKNKIEINCLKYT